MAEGLSGPPSKLWVFTREDEDEEDDDMWDEDDGDE